MTHETVGLPWLCEQIAAILGQDGIDPDEPLRNQGMESRQALELVVRLEARLGREVPVTLPWTCPTPRLMVAWCEAGPEAEAASGPRRRARPDEPIAIVGIGCRFPRGCHSPEQLWDFILAGGDGITQVPGSRWNVDRHYDADPTAPGKMTTRFGGFLDDIEGFDASFFGIAPREALQMDPHQRVFLEVAWAGLEDAGVVPGGLRGSETGVFVGSMWQEYTRLAGAESIVQHTIAGADGGIIAARVAYFLGLMGPALTVNTACSSSLVAVHLAAHSLRRGESRLAIAGGINLMLGPHATIGMSKFGAMSPTGQCRSFDAGANGYVRGEGCGALVLQPLSDAVAEGRSIYAVLHGSAVNNDGASNGLHAPSVHAQVDVLRRAWDEAKVAPRDAWFVEAHGTGTRLGDPIETEALGTIFAPDREAPLLLGSVKTNIGHTESAAGVAGLIKAALALKHGVFPPNLHFDTPNPLIPFAERRLEVVAEPRPRSSDAPLYAGVSSFGFGGTNSHIVLGEGPRSAGGALALAADSPGALREAAAARLAALRAAPAGDFAPQDDALPQGRCRALVRDDRHAERVAALEALASGREAGARVADAPPRLVLVFSGHGGQWLGMGQGELARDAAFAATLDRCAAAIRRWGGPEVAPLLAAEDALPTEAAQVQPAIFALQVALAAALEWRGIRPDAVVGHSIGEVAAAVVAGALSIEQGARVIVAQSRLVSETVEGDGGAVVVELGPARAAALLEEAFESLSISGVLSPEQVTVSGPRPALAELEYVLGEQGARVWWVDVDYAVHAPALDPLEGRLRAALEGLEARPPALDLASPSADGPLGGVALGPAFWWNNLRRPVDLGPALERVAGDGPAVFLEVGPHPVLQHPIEQLLDRWGAPDRRHLATLRRGALEWGAADLQAELWAHGIDGVPSEPRVDPRAAPLLLSARTAAGLRLQASRLAEHLAANRSPAPRLADVAHTRALHRSHLVHRLGLQVGSTAEAEARLRAFAEGAQDLPGLQTGAAGSGPPQLAFVFTGQGSQRVGMGATLYRWVPAFRATLDAVAEAFAPHLPEPLLPIVFGTAPGDPGRLDQTAWTQPALFALEVALARLWLGWGVRPDVLMGHSVGELAAAHVAGVFSLEDACRLVAARARAMQALPGGSMASLALSESEAIRLLGELPQSQRDGLCVAAVNSPSQTVVSGPDAAVVALVARAKQAGLRAKRLRVSHAFHSTMMEPMLDGFRAVAATVAHHPPTLPLICNETGRLAEADTFDGEYWVRHVRDTVRFSDGVGSALDAGVTAFIEIGPRPALSGMVAATAGAREVACLPSLRGKDDAWTELMASVVAWHCRGAQIDWEAVHRSLPGRRIPLPGYAFEHQRFWVDPVAAAAPQGLGQRVSPWLGQGGPVADTGSLLFATEVSVERLPWIADHRVFGRAIVPGTAFLELARVAAEELDAAGGWAVGDMTIRKPLDLSSDGRFLLQTSIRRADEHEGSMRIHSAPVGADGALGPWRLHASARLCAAEPQAAEPAETSLPPAGARPLDIGAHYDQLEALGLGYGPAFQCLKAAWRTDAGVWARLELDATTAASTWGRGVHPALLDSALHAVYLAIAQQGDALDAPHLPFEWRALDVRRVGLERAWLFVPKVELKDAASEASLALYDDAGALALRVGGITMRRADPSALGDLADRARQATFEVSWQPLGVTEPTDLGPRSCTLFAVDPADPRRDGVQQALEAAGCAVRVVAELPDPLPAGRLVCLWPARNPAAPETVHRLTEAGLALLHRLLPAAADTQTTWLTCGAMATEGRLPPPQTGHWAAAGLWGLARTARHEHPELSLTLVDLQAGPTPPDADAALALALAARGEPELALRDGAVLIPRLQRRDRGATLTLPSTPAFRLESARKGSLQELRLAPVEPTPLAAGQVRIDVRASALNFRDVMDALGLYGGRAVLENDCAGVVVEVGEGVTDLAPGDRVFGMAPGALGTRAVTDARLVAPIPEDLDFAGAATLPIAALTAAYALEDLARVQPGERVLIHAAMGGLGMAAVRLARYLGAEVYATASPGKWPYLVAMGFDRSHIASSRDTRFAEQFPKMDVVLNSLKGPFIDAGLGLLREGGRFIEVGKADVRDAAEVAQAHPGVTYRQFILFDAGLERLQELLRLLARRVAEGTLVPLQAQTAPIVDAIDVYRRMAQGRHIGKLLLASPVAEAQARGGAAIVTGGFGALAGHAARHLVASGGLTHLVLVSRRGAQSPGAEERVAELEALGASVSVVACDLADGAAVDRLVATPWGAPLRGVVHTAAVLDDATVARTSVDQLHRVLAPKVDGAWHLHRATLGLDLDFFVLYSSAASVVGNAGQAAYNAANTALDALALARRGAGLPATSVAWGLWLEDGAGAGIAHAVTAADRARMLRAGLGEVTPALGGSLLDSALRGGPAVSVAMSLSTGAVQRSLRDSGAEVPPLLRALVRSPARPAPSAASLRERLLGLPVDSRRDTLRDSVRDIIAKVLGMPNGSHVEPDLPLQSLGIDSLMAVELRNQLAAVGVKSLPATLAFDYPTADAITDLLMEKADLGAPAAVPPVEATAVSHDEPIAIVGMACRFPGGVTSPEGLWALLSEGSDAITEIPAERWDIDAWYDPDPDARGKTYSRWGGFLDGLDRFDAPFFGVSPREAPSIDPQARLLFETIWEALERWGTPPHTLRGSDTGVYCGILGIEYFNRTMASPQHIDTYSFDPALSAQTGRLSYFFGFEGPNFPVDTACSSSLVALHLACQGLRNDECSLAIAGGVNVLLDPEGYLTFSRLHAMSPTGRCQAFSADADGYVRAEGCGVLVLKRLSDAERDGDRVLALVRGTAVNQDGRSASPTAPNGPSQQRVIQAALRRSGVPAHTIDFAECHGTGTRLGDPIEVQALARVYGEGRPPDAPLVLGSIKSNIGHCEAAAGVAGVIKAVLALQHGEVPRTLHAERLNPHIPWAELPVRVAREAVPQPPRPRPVRCGVSSFGVGGTNAHVILEEAPPRAEPPGPVPRPTLPRLPLLLSGHTDAALQAQAAALHDHLEAHPGLALDEVAHALAIRRTHHAHRAAFPVEAGGREAALGLLRAAAQGAPSEGLVRGISGLRARKVALLFSGQGTQLPRMGHRLYQQVPAFRRALDEIAERFAAHLDFDLLEVMFAEAGSPEAASLVRPERSQPALFAVEVALARLWQSWGVVPSAVAGHSIGELAAAHVAGVFDLDDACRLIAARSRLLTAFVEGRMVAIFAPRARTEALLAACETDDLHIALLNAPTQVVVSGTEVAVAALAERATHEGVDHRVLPIPGAGHSPLIDPVLEPFRAVARSIRYRAPVMPVMSNAHGRAATAEELTSPEHWVEHVRRAVRFTDCIDALVEEGCDVFLEVGPRRALARMAEQCVGPGRPALYLTSLTRQQTDWDDLARSLMRWHCAGGAVDWDAVLPAPAGPPPHLPTYAFQRRRHWIEASARQDRAAAGPLRFDAGSLRRILHAAEQQAAVVPTDLDLGALATVQERWTAAAHSLLLSLCPPEGRFDAADVIRRNAIAAGFAHLVPRWLRVLTEAGALELSADGHQVARVERPKPSDLFDEADALAPQFGGWTEFLRRCAATWAAVLRGERSGLDNLFPDGSRDLADQLYRTGPVARYMNGILRGVVGAAQAQPSSTGPLRILEVGAGTGGTTLSVAPVLVPGTTYRFTDLSDFFFRAARQRLAEADATFEFAVLDLERPLDGQGVAPHSVDLLLASNVLHATSDLPRTLARLRGALRPGGLLVAWEVTEHPPWFEFSTTQIEGWNLADDDLRAEVPLMAVEAWRAALAEAGFDAVEALPAADAPTALLGQHVLVARSPGGATDPRSAQADAPGAPAADPRSRAVAPFDRAALLAAPAADRGALLLDDLCAFLAAFLGREEPVRPEVGLVEAGMDSLLAIELRRALKERYGVELLLGELAAYPSPGALAPMLCAVLEAAGDAPDAAAIAAVVGDSLRQSGALDDQPADGIDLLALGELARAAVFSDLGRAFGVALRPTDLAGVSAVRDLAPILLRRRAGLPGRTALAQTIGPSPAFFERYEAAVDGLVGDLAGLQRRSLATDAGELEVFDVGEGPPLLLLPPLNGSALIWFQQLRELSRDHRVLAPNYPGYGRSTIGGDLSLAGLRGAMEAVVDALGLQRFSVAGWSLGGAVAQLLAAARRESVDALVLVNTSAYLGLQGTAEEFHTVLGYLNAEYDAYPGAGPGLTALSPEEVVVGVRGSDRIDLSYLYFSHVAQGDFREALGQAGVPTLVVSGEKDRITPVKQGEEMAERSGGAHRVVADHGHLVPLFQPAEFNRWVRDLLAQAAPRAGGPPRRA